MESKKLTFFITIPIFLFFVFSFPGESAGKIDAIKVYRNNCEKCHGEDGKGTTRGKALGVPDFTDASWQDWVSDTEFLHAITYGKGKMPSWKGELTPEEMMAVAKFVRSFASKRGRR
ncbi:MAG TPA: c-type cytochrome [Candidatus Brocadiia bacterium]|nr:cytochrome c [Planctomycetota bacterium]MBI4008153.1 cytochrome c [Planctomycetota bacterium]MDO8093523.1 cytochrome c [Candidatus Brocadiales bacterium]